jgi:cell wall-associated NlpC family hydrolase
VATTRLAHLRTRTSRIRPASLAIVAASAALVSLVGPAPATSAAPQLSIGQVQARIEALNTRAERITESYNAARERLTTLHRQQRVTADRLRHETARLAGVRAQISATADAAYRSGGLGDFVLGGADSPETFLDQAVTLDAISRSQSQTYAEAAAAGHSVAAAKASYDAQTAVVTKTVKRISGQKAHIESLIAQAHHLLASLRAADRARLSAAATQTAVTQTSLRSSYHGPASGRAAVAVRFAYAQLGKPYYYGGAGPNSYDCSGLTMRAWGAAGVSLSHNAAAQQASTRYVSGSALQAGDLVFFGSPAYHVGIYIGGGRMIAAPHTGDVVKIQPISYVGGFSGGGRP